MFFFCFFYGVPKFETSIFPALWRPWDCCSKFIALNTMNYEGHEINTASLLLWPDSSFIVKPILDLWNNFIFVMDFASKSRIFMSPQVLQWKRFVRFEWQVNWCFNKGDLLSLVYQIPRSRKGWGWWLIFSSAKANKLVWFRVLVFQQGRRTSYNCIFVKEFVCDFCELIKNTYLLFKTRKRKGKRRKKQTYKIILETDPNKVVKKGISVQGVEASTKFRCKLPIKTQDSSSARFNRAS